MKTRTSLVATASLAKSVTESSTCGLTTKSSKKLTKNKTTSFETSKIFCRINKTNTILPNKSTTIAKNRIKKKSKASKTTPESRNKNSLDLSMKYSNLKSTLETKKVNYLKFKLVLMISKVVRI